MNNPDLHPFWDQTLSDWQASGLSGAAFCKEQSLSYHRFVYWRGKLQSRGQPASSRNRQCHFSTAGQLATPCRI